MPGGTERSAACNRKRGVTTYRILVAGIGNIFLGDDGFGPEVMRHVPQGLAGPHVQLVDYGIRGMHLAYDLLDGCEALVLVDAIPSSGAPGTLHVFEADNEASPPQWVSMRTQWTRERCSRA